MTLATVTYRISESLYGDSEGFYNGSSAVSSLVPGAYDVALDGIPLMLDNNPEDLYRIPRINGPSSIPAQTQQQDQSIQPGEQSLNRGDVWRKAFADFTHGAGQTWYDRSQSDQQRFRSSKGVDVWTRDKFTLLPDTTKLVSGTSGKALVVHTSVANQITWLDQGVSLKKFALDATDTVSSASSVTGFTTPGGFAARPLTSDGIYAYAVDISGGVDGTIRKVLSGAATSSLVATLTGVQIDGICYAKGRLVAWSGIRIYDCTAGGTFASPIASLQTLSDLIVDMTGGTTNIYIGSWAYFGGGATIYSIAPDASTTALGNLAYAGALPVGEQLTTIFGYRGYVLIGTDKGFRLAQENSDGTLTIGDLVNIGVAVQKFTAVGQYVYFTWTNYDSASTGLGRINLAAFTDTLTPAYASDIMATAQGIVKDVAVMDNGSGICKPYFVIPSGIYTAAATPVASGSLNTGYAAWDIADSKTATGCIIRTEPLSGAVVLALTNSANGTSANVDSLNVAGSTGGTLTIHNVVGSEFELNLTLTPSAGNVAPGVTGLTLLARPAPASGRYWTVPVLLADDLMCRDGIRRPMNVQTTLNAFQALRSPSTTPVSFQIGNQSYTVFLDEYENHPHHANNRRDGYSSTCVLTLKDLSSVAV